MIVIDFLINLLSTVLLLTGAFLAISGAVGLFRFPDFFTRLHAAGITDTLCTACIIGGLVLQSGFSLITVKLIFIFLFTWYTSPAAGHALVRAANKTGLRPLLRQDAKAKDFKTKAFKTKTFNMKAFNIKAFKAKIVELKKAVQENAQLKNIQFKNTESKNTEQDSSKQEGNQS